MISSGFGSQRLNLKITFDGWKLTATYKLKFIEALYSAKDNEKKHELQMYRYSLTKW